MKLKNIYDSAVNSRGELIEKGMKATRVLWNSKVPYMPYTVVGVSKTGNTVVLQRDTIDYENYDNVEGWGKPIRDENGEKIEATLSKKGGNYRYNSDSHFRFGEWKYYRELD